MNASKMTQTERTGKTVFMYHVLNYCKCEDSNGGVYFCDVMVYLSCCCCACLIQKLLPVGMPTRSTAVQDNAKTHQCLLKFAPLYLHK